MLLSFFVKKIYFRNILDLHIMLYFRIEVGIKEEAVWRENY